MKLNAGQRRLNRLRLEQHRHEDYTVDLNLGSSNWLMDFEVHKGVFRPEVGSGIKLAEYLARNPDLYAKKKVLDMGCGTGIQGIVMGKNIPGRAREIAFSDISEEAVRNAFDNAMKYRLLEKSRFFQGDLFDGIPFSEKYDFIVCNHPFLPGKPVKSVPVSRAWLNDGELIHQFLEGAKGYLSESGGIVMPFSDIAGTANHPGIQGKRHGYKVWVSPKSKIEYDKGFESGFRFYHLRK